MRYVIVSNVNGDAGTFNNNIRREVFNRFKARSSKLPAHFTIKAPFQSDNIQEIESALCNFCKNHHGVYYDIKNYDHFGNRVIYMKVLMSDEGRVLHNELIEAISFCKDIEFQKSEGKDKVFHITVTSKKIQDKFDEIWRYVNDYPCEFHCKFDNVTIYKWEDMTWKLHKEYKMI